MSAKTKRAKAPVVRVGLLGLGTVGAGVAEILSRHGSLIAERTGLRLRVTRALVRKTRRKRGGAAGAVPLTTRASAVIGAEDVDIVAELVGGIEPARGLILDALRAGKPVVTANKAVIAAHGAEIFRAAAAAGSDVYFEAAVAGGIPIIRTLREGLASDRITEIMGILNGTTNYILDQMGQGADYGAALAEAQLLGFAEADPTLDVNGRDAADKLAILMHLAFGTRARAEKISTEGITSLTPEVLADAERLGYRVKLLGIARRVGTRGVDARVHPAFVPADHVLSHVPAAQNAIAVQSDSLGSTLYQGAGAGGLPTGSAVVSDLIEVARNLKAGISGRIPQLEPKRAPRLVPEADAVSAYYMRLRVAERPGVLAAITELLARHDISLATVLQRERTADTKRPVPVVITTHATPHGQMQAALKAIRKLRALRGPPDVVRIEVR